jgi:hypothetical protein
MHRGATTIHAITHDARDYASVHLGEALDLSGPLNVMLPLARAVA